MYTKFADRKKAGKTLVARLGAYLGMPDAIILALPRGGVVVAHEVAKALHLPLDLMLVRKLGVPGDEEFAFGAIAMGDVSFINEETVQYVQMSPAQVQEVVERERQELLRRNEVYRDGRPAPDVAGKTVLLIDDGVATGSDMLVAVRAVRQMGASRVVVAVPVSSDSAFDLLQREADEVVCPHVPRLFLGVGSFYEDFSQTEDDEVLRILREE